MLPRSPCPSGGQRNSRVSWGDVTEVGQPSDKLPKTKGISWGQTKEIARPTEGDTEAAEKSPDENKEEENLKEGVSVEVEQEDTEESLDPDDPFGLPNEVDNMACLLQSVVEYLPGPRHDLHYDLHSFAVRWTIWRVCVNLLLNILLVLVMTYIMLLALRVMADGCLLISRVIISKVITSESVMTSYLGCLGLGFIMSAVLQSCPNAVVITLTLVFRTGISTQLGVFMVMGADLGSSWLATWVAYTLSCRRDVVRRAIAGSTVTDMFNWLKIIMFFPLEALTGMLNKMSYMLVSGMSNGSNLTYPRSPLVQFGLSRQQIPCERLSDLLADFYTPKPVTGKILRPLPIDAHNMTMYDNGKTLLKKSNDYSFSGWSFSDEVAGCVLLGLAFLFLLVCTTMLSKVLDDLMTDPFILRARRPFNLDIPFRGKGWLVIIWGCVMTFVAEKGVVANILFIPYLGAGMVTLYRVYEIALGAQVGNSLLTLYIVYSSVLGYDCQRSMQIAVFHMLYAFLSVFIWYASPVLRKIPVQGAKDFGLASESHRFLPITYMLGKFVLLPLALVGLATFVFEVEVALFVLIYLLALFIIIMNVLQQRIPGRLPWRLRSWKNMGVPAPLRSLEPYDKALKKVSSNITQVVSSQNFYIRGMRPLGTGVQGAVGNVMTRMRLLGLLGAKGNTVQPEDEEGATRA
ncbi:hypothetical protein BaRGS_00009991 [Batillaria attramentaria]|uniref:Uncharacterized protein n=1 Tax=Batillaria attramentaria TaxID=370345 RepID=A0ABD0LH26_9CAEN